MDTDLADSGIDALRHELEDRGVRLVMGTVVNAAGVTLAKCVPVARLGAFHRSGMGTAPVWDVFTVDGGIAFTDTISAVGDRRLRIDPAALRVIDSGLAWAPCVIHTQDGAVAPTCTRSLLGRVEQSLADAGLEAKVGHELEFVLVAPDGTELDAPGWVPYGMTGLLDHATFVDDLVTSLGEAGVDVEQIHAEYGRSQFELSLPPASAVVAADVVVLTRIVVGVVARRHGLGVSFSPAPFPGSVGNGAHQHVSLTREGRPLFSGGDGPHGMTTEGGAAIGGLVANIPEVQGLLTGSVLSGMRLAPGTWSGAFRCWGLENREACVRFLSAGTGNPHGANVEVKCIDPSANVHLASAAVLSLALDGIRNRAPLPAEVADDPSKLDEPARDKAGITVLCSDPAAVIDTLAGSDLARRLLGSEIVDATVVVRRLEMATFADVSVDDLAQQLRLAWSV